MEIHHGYSPWKGGPNDQTAIYFGHADWDVAKAQGKSAQEIADWARANPDKFGRGTASKAYQEIMAAARNAGSSGSGYSLDSIDGGRSENSTRSNQSWISRDEGGSSENSRSDSNNSKSYIVDQTANVDNSVYTEIGNDNVFGNNSSIGNNEARTDINQTLADFLGKRSFGDRSSRQDAAVNNSTTTKVGDRNKFGDGLKLGNNYAVTDINQSTGKKRYAGDRLEDWMEVQGN